MESPNVPLNEDPAGTDPLPTAARGWQRVQLAVFGLIGLCGVLWASGDQAGPTWLRWLATALAVGSLAVACVALYLVTVIAYPPRAPHRSADAATSARRLRAGVWLTCLATAAVVAATLSAWWPESGADAQLVEVRDVTGTTWCGELGTGPPGTVQLETTGGQVAVPLESVASFAPATGCE